MTSNRAVASLLLGILLALPTLAVPAVAKGEEAPPETSAPIRVDGGLVSGVEQPGGVRAYLAIPYAAPPVGSLRWKPPRPVLPWRGVRPCTAHGNWCWQPAPLIGKELGPMSEDCLTLSVWTTAGRGAKQPVMVWIHGGGFTTGSGAARPYDGANLARKGVVVVTINYRLGPFGFFAHPRLSKESPRGVSGNYGFLDQVAALEWVKKNIAAFGGDANRVTIFGESAGGVSVGLHLISPLSKGLFHRSILQSGSVCGPFRHLRVRHERFAAMEADGERIARALGVGNAANALDTLRAVPAEKLLEVSKPTQGLFGKGTKFWPVVDGWAIPEQPARLLETGRRHKVPILVGSNADEGTIFLAQLPVKRVPGYRMLLRAFFGDDATAVFNLFPARGNTDVKNALNRVVTVSVFVTAARRTARAVSRTQSKAWLYHFVRVPPLPHIAPYGAFHSAEIPYVFGNLHLPWGFNETDRRLSQAMMNAWVAFARSGNPNGEGLAHWPAYDTKTDVHLFFGDEIQPASGLYREACDLFDRAARRRAPPEVR